MSHELDQPCIDMLRFLSVDAGQTANGGHPGLPLGAAPERLQGPGWHRHFGAAGDVLSGERFGASGPADVLLRDYAFTLDEVCRRALALRR